MADEKSGILIDEVPEIPEELEKIVGHALNRGKDELEKGEILVPFTAVLVKDQVLLELQPGDNPQECFNLARHTVEGMRGATSYAFCYDGFIDTNQGMKDAIIAEGGLPGEEKGYALAYMYTIDKTDADGNPTDVTVDPTLTYIGEVDNFMKGLKNDTDYTETDVADIEKGEELEHINAEESGEPVKE